MRDTLTVKNGSTKIPVKPGERLRVPQGVIDGEFRPLLEELSKALSEEDLVKSMLENLNFINEDMYQRIKADYRVAHTEANNVKSKVSRFIMDHYEATSGDLSWSFTSLDFSVTVYTK